MTAWTSSSAIVASMRPVFSSSWAVRAARRIPRILPGDSVFTSSAFVTRVVRRFPCSEPERVLLERSRLFRICEEALVRTIAARQGSVALARLTTMVQPNAPAARVRLLGWMAASAVVTHAGLEGLTASGWGWMAAFPLCLACIRRPEAVLTAWPTSRVRRVVDGHSSWPETS